MVSSSQKLSEIYYFPKNIIYVPIIFKKIFYSVGSDNIFYGIINGTYN